MRVYKKRRILGGFVLSKLILSMSIILIMILFSSVVFAGKGVITVYGYKESIVIYSNSCSSSANGESSCTLSSYTAANCCSGTGSCGSYSGDRSGNWYFRSFYDSSFGVGYDLWAHPTNKQFAFSCSPICKYPTGCDSFGSLGGSCSYSNLGADDYDTTEDWYANGWTCGGDEHCDGCGGCVSDCYDADGDGYGIRPGSGDYYIGDIPTLADTGCAG